MRTLILFSLVSLTLTLHAQTLPSHLLGDWEAICVPEKVDTNRVSVCGICPTVVSDSSAQTVSTLTLNFRNNSLTIKTKDASSAIPIKYDEAVEHLVFTFDGMVYDFSILYVDVLSKIILKSQDGNLIYLERKNNLKNE